MSQQIDSLNIDDDAKSLLFTLVAENAQLKAENDELKSTPISTNEACKYLGIGRKKFWELSKSDNHFPQAQKFGKTNFYPKNELKVYRDNIIRSPTQ